MDNARLLYNKGLKHQSLKILERAKEIAKANNKLNFLAQLISLEKKIETLHITRSTLEKTEQLTIEAREISDHIDRVTRLSNLALLLYRWYVQNGHARNEADVKKLREFLNRIHFRIHPTWMISMRNCISTRVIAGSRLFARISSCIIVMDRNGSTF